LEYRFEGDEGKQHYTNFGDYVGAATKGRKLDFI